MSGLVKGVSLRLSADNAGPTKAQLDDISVKSEKLREPIEIKFAAISGEASGEIKSLTDSLAGLDESAVKASESSARVGETAKGISGELGSARSATISFGDSLKGLGDEAARVREIELSLAEADKQLLAGERLLASSAAAEARSMKTLAAAQAELSGKSAEAGAAAAAAGSKAEKTGGLLATLGSKAKFAGVGLAVAALASIHMAGTFDQSTTRLATSAGETTQQLGNVRTGILRMSADTATSLDELVKGMYMIESAGYHGAAGLKVLRAAAQGAKAEGADLGEVANAVTSALNSYGYKASDATKVTDMLVKIVSEGKMTMQDLASSIHNVLPVAAAVHISFSEVGGAIATMTGQGMSAKQATQDLAHTIRSLSGPNGVAVKEMQALGLNANDVSKNLGKRGLTGTIELLENAILSRMGPSGDVLFKAFAQTKQAAADARIMLNSMPASIRGVADAYLNGTISEKAWRKEMQGMPVDMVPMLNQFTTVVNHTRSFNDLLRSGGPAAQTFLSSLNKVMGGATGLNTALMVGGQHMGTFKANVAGVADSARQAGKEVTGWDLIQKGFNFQLTQAKDASKAVAVSFGEALMPAALAVIKPIAQFGTWLAHNSAASKVFAGIIGGLVVVLLGTKLVKAFSEAQQAGELMFKGIGKLVGLIPMQTAETEGATAAQRGLNLAFLTSPVGLIVAGLAVLVTGIVLIATKTKWFQEAWDASWGFVKRVFDDVFEWIKQNWPLILGILTGPIGLAVAEIIRHWDTIKGIFKEGIHFVSRLVTDGLNTVRNVFKSALEFVVTYVRTEIKIVETVFAWFGKLGSLLYGWFMDGYHAVEHVVTGNLLPLITGLPGKIVSGLARLGTDMWNIGVNIIQGIINGVESMVKKLLGYLGNIASDIANTFSSVLGIFSPSRVFRAFGQFIVLGLIHGIKDLHGMAVGTVGDLATAMASRFSPQFVTAPGRGANPLAQGNTYNVYVTVQGVVGDAGATGKQIAEALNTYLRQTGQAQLVGV